MQFEEQAAVVNFSHKFIIAKLSKFDTEDIKTRHQKM